MIEQKKKILKGVIFFNDPFPIGQAATNRILAIAKGLNECECFVEVLVLRPTENSQNIINKDSKGEYEGIRYKYIEGNQIKSDFFVKRIFSVFLGYFLAFLYLLKNKKKKDFFINPLDSFVFAVICNLATLGSSIVKIRMVDEYPPIVLNPLKFTSIYKKLYLKYFYRQFDLVVPITRTLLEFYKKISPRKMEFLHVPMTVDTDRFDVKSKPENKIIYCGNLGCNKKDGVDDLIKAFNLFSRKYPNYELVLVGSTNQTQELLELKALVKSLNLNERVFFTGLVKSTEIPKLLSKARILALSRPNNIQGQGGFPTKLGEYLATGIPVVVTDVGEISDYLSDGDNAFIAQASDYRSFAAKMEELVINYDRAQRIGQRGRLTALKFFNYKYQGKLLYAGIKKKAEQRRNICVFSK